jgi:peptidase inhibitor family I36
MTHILTAVTMPKRRVAAAVLVCALLGLASALATSPGTASAATGTCDPGEFCMYYLTNFRGGLYEFSGSDSNLNNDHFENSQTNQIVGNNTESVWNRGVSDPSGLNHVLVYSGPSFTGSAMCVTRGRKANLPANWQNNIESYRWVNADTCNRFVHL